MGRIKNCFFAAHSRNPRNSRLILFPISDLVSLCFLAFHFTALAVIQRY